MSEIKFLYHGTSAKYLDPIKEKGILPRSISNKKGNWAHTVGSNKNAVYLTDAYAWHMAGAASKNKDLGLIIEIDRSKLYDWLLCPDEDFMEQATRTQEPPEYPNFAPLNWSMKQRTLFYRKIARYNPNLADMSLRAMGTCGYYNNIPWAAVTRYVIIDWGKLHAAIQLMALDSMVSILNYKVLQNQHRALTKWFFGDEVAPEELMHFNKPSFDDDISCLFKGYFEGMNEAMKIKEGLNININEFYQGNQRVA